ncbi:MAG: hypothetical protein ACJZ33_04230 [Candidatus Poseidoniales archaeon]
MDLTEKFLPNEKFLKKYENLSVNRKTGYSIAITNLRVFISNKNEVWDIYSDKIDYLGRLFTPMFSWWWQLIFVPISLMTLDGSKLISAIFILLSIARQQIRIETLTIGVKSKNWNVTKDNETLDQISEDIRLNSIVGVIRKDGKQILEAEDIGKSPKLNIELIGENESRPLVSAWSFAAMSFLSYYASSFGAGTGFWTFFLAIISIGFFIIHRDRKKTNEFRGVDPKPGLMLQGYHYILNYFKIPIINTRWSFPFYQRKIYARDLGYQLCCIFLLLGLFITYANENMVPLLAAIAIGLPIYLIGRTLSGIPRSNKRMALRSISALLIGLLVVIPCLSLIPMYDTASVRVPNSFIQGDSGNGWKNIMNDYDEYGLGLASTTFSLYVDDAEDNEGNSDGYPGILIVVAVKVPIDIEEKDMLSELDKQFERMAVDQEVELDSEIEKGSRITKQGYETQYSIFNGTAKTDSIGFEGYNRTITEGSKTLYIGEVWKAPEYNLIVVAMGIAIISEEEINDQTGIDPIDDFISNIIPDNPNDTTNMQNWLELLDIIPETVCYSN